jgi:hypothetical protein
MKFKVDEELHKDIDSLFLNFDGEYQKSINNDNYEIDTSENKYTRYKYDNKSGNNGVSFSKGENYIYKEDESKYKHICLANINSVNFVNSVPNYSSGYILGRSIYTKPKPPVFDNEFVETVYNNETENTVYVNIRTSTYSLPFSKGITDIKLVEGTNDDWAGVKDENDENAKSLNEKLREASDLNESYSYECTLVPANIITLNHTFDGVPVCNPPIFESIPGCKIRDLTYTFANCSKLDSDKVANMNLPSSLTNMIGAFCNSTISRYPEIPSNVSDLSSTFSGTDITDISEINIPRSVTNISNIFSYSKVNSTLPQLILPNLINGSSSFRKDDKVYEQDSLSGNINISAVNVTDMSHAFENNMNIRTLDLTVGTNISDLSYLICGTIPSDEDDFISLNKVMKIENLSINFTGGTINNNINCSHLLSGANNYNGSGRIANEIINKINVLDYAFTQSNNNVLNLFPSGADLTELESARYAFNWIDDDELDLSSYPTILDLFNGNKIKNLTDLTCAFGRTNLKLPETLHINTSASVVRLFKKAQINSLNAIKLSDLVVNTSLMFKDAKFGDKNSYSPYMGNVTNAAGMYSGSNLYGLGLLPEGCDITKICYNLKRNLKFVFDISNVTLNNSFTGASIGTVYLINEDQISELLSEITNKKTVVLYTPEYSDLLTTEYHIRNLIPKLINNGLETKIYVMGEANLRSPNAVSLNLEYLLGKVEDDDSKCVYTDYSNDVTEYGPNIICNEILNSSDNSELPYTISQESYSDELIKYNLTYNYITSISDSQTHNLVEDTGNLLYHDVFKFDITNKYNGNEWKTDWNKNIFLIDLIDPGEDLHETELAGTSKIVFDDTFIISRRIDKSPIIVNTQYKELKNKLNTVYEYLSDKLSSLTGENLSISPELYVSIYIDDNNFIDDNEIESGYIINKEAYINNKGLQSGAIDQNKFNSYGETNPIILNITPEDPGRMLSMDSDGNLLVTILPNNELTQYKLKIVYIVKLASINDNTKVLTKYSTYSKEFTIIGNSNDVFTDNRDETLEKENTNIILSGDDSQLGTDINFYEDMAN